MLTTTVCAAVSAAGLGIAALTAYRKRFLAATRIAAFSLIPIGLVMTGVVDWVGQHRLQARRSGPASGCSRSPSLLFMISRGVERRRGGTHRKERKAAAADRPDAVAPAASAPSLGAGRLAAQPARQGEAAQGRAVPQG